MGTGPANAGYKSVFPCRTEPERAWSDCAAAASMQGGERIGAHLDGWPKRERVKLSELQRRTQQW